MTSIHLGPRMIYVLMASGYTREANTNHAITLTYLDARLRLHAIHPATSDSRTERVTALECLVMTNLLGHQQGAAAYPSLGKKADRWSHRLTNAKHSARQGEPGNRKFRRRRQDWGQRRTG